MARARRVAEATLEELRDFAHVVWVVVVPVGQKRPADNEPHLRDTWFTRIEDRGGALWLIFGATARYAIYVELGTGKMAPRAPIRTTAGEVTPLIEPVLRRKFIEVI